MRKRTRNLVITGAGLLLITVICGRQAMASTVCAESCDFTSIQDAIDGASEYGEVLVYPGTYHEKITFSGNKKVYVYSSNGPLETIIDGGNTPGRPVVSFTCPSPIPAPDSHSNPDPDPEFDMGFENYNFITGFTITNGSASQGGGLYIAVDNFALVENCIITGNRADEGGAFYVGEGSIGQFTKSIITNNSADVGGGGYVRNGHITFISGSIKNNSATSGAGGGAALLGDLSNGLFSKSIISDNTAKTSGGGIAAYGSYMYVDNCLIAKNSADISGGGIDSGIKGGEASHMQLYFLNNTISANSAGTSGGGLSHDGVAQVVGLNNIFWGDNPDEISVLDPSLVTMTSSDIQGGWESDSFTAEGKNVDCDPQFVGDQNSDDVGDFHLTIESCCIDAGAYGGNSFSYILGDIEDKTRPVGAGYDIGAYEFGCSDADSDGFSVCDGDCNDLNSEVNPDGLEICGNGLDDNCDGLIDCEDKRACRQDLACSDTRQPKVREICSDGIDNDGDSKVDCADKSECRKDPACQ